MLDLIYPTAAILTMGIGAFLGTAKNIVPNKLVLGGLVLWLVAALTMAGPIKFIAVQFFAAVLAYLICLCLNLMKSGIGGGVGRATALVTLWVPLSELFGVWVVAMVAGGVWAIISLGVDKAYPRSDGVQREVRLAGIMFAVGLLAFIL